MVDGSHYFSISRVVIVRSWFDPHTARRNHYRAPRYLAGLHHGSHVGGYIGTYVFHSLLFVSSPLTNVATHYCLLVVH